ncbi:hypothetical protein [Candidatus Sororendozoicomonas aggregata]|uniref:hypothetical protein n=1 Tax=Candidatus Sororendozoicomonas aggregata TaxID=3073239 RepID=UPI002ED54357
MNRVLPAIVTFIYMMFFTNVSFAIIHPEGTLEVSFINNTNYDCTINARLTHGEWVKNPPKSISKHKTISWSATQKCFFGPDMTIKFTCGDYSFSTRNQQNYCSLKGGNQTLSISDIDKHLNVTNRQIQHAAYGSEKPGKAQIVVTSKGKGRHFGFE